MRARTVTSGPSWRGPAAASMARCASARRPAMVSRTAPVAGSFASKVAAAPPHAGAVVNMSATDRRACGWRTREARAEAAAALAAIRRHRSPSRTWGLAAPQAARPRAPRHLPPPMASAQLLIVAVRGDAPLRPPGERHARLRRAIAQSSRLAATPLPDRLRIVEVPGCHRVAAGWAPRLDRLAIVLAYASATRLRSATPRSLALGAAWGSPSPADRCRSPSWDRRQRRIRSFRRVDSGLTSPLSGALIALALALAWVRVPSCWLWAAASGTQGHGPPLSTPGH